MRKIKIFGASAWPLPIPLRTSRPRNWPTASAPHAYPAPAASRQGGRLVPVFSVKNSSSALTCFKKNRLDDCGKIGSFGRLLTCSTRCPSSSAIATESVGEKS